MLVLVCLHMSILLLLKKEKNFVIVMVYIVLYLNICIVKLSGAEVGRKKKAERQEKLKTYYYFDCTCIACHK